MPNPQTPNRGASETRRRLKRWALETYGEAGRISVPALLAKLVQMRIDEDHRKGGLGRKWAAEPKGKPKPRPAGDK